MVRRSVYAGIITVVMCAFLAGCAKPPVAVVNGKAIDRDTLDLVMKEWVREHARQNIKVDGETLKRSVLPQLVDERLALDEAAKRGIGVSDEEMNKAIDSTRGRMGKAAFQAMLDDAGMSLDSYRKRTRERMIMARFKETLQKTVSITEEELRDYYRNSQKPFIKPARMLVKMIEMESEDVARRALKEMRDKNMDFDDLARRLKSQGKATVIDYGWVKAEFFSPEISAGLMNLRKGQYGGPYRGKTRSYLIRLKQREKERIATFAEVREDIRKILTERRTEEAFAIWLDRRKRSSTVEISLK
jgi:parvulin-like peptidyl-prolyl isomerase